MHFGVAMRGAEIVAAPDDSSVTVKGRCSRLTASGRETRHLYDAIPTISVVFCYLTKVVF